MQRRTMTISALVISATLASLGRTQEPLSIKVDAPLNRMKYGDPLLLQVVLTFGEPQISRRTSGVLQGIKVEHPYLHVQSRAETGTAGVSYWIGSIEAPLSGGSDTQYTANVVGWYERRKDDDKWQMIFDRPATYEITLVDGGRIRSNTVSVVVEPSVLGEKAVTLLGKHEDFIFLEYGLDKSPASIAALEEVVKQCNGTVIAQMAAARLGIEAVNELEEKYASIEEFAMRYRRGEIQEPLVASAQSYLARAQRLPAQYPIGESVLESLAKIQVVAGNYEAALSLVDELGTKYPNGEYGSRADSMKAEVKALMGPEPQAADEAQGGNHGERPRVVTLGMVAVVSIAILAAVLLTGYALVSKRKDRGR